MKQQTLSARTDVVAPAGFWRRDTAHAPVARTPMTNSMMDEAPAMLAACEDFGLLINLRLATIGGWFYGSVEPVGAPPDRAAPPAWLLPWLLRLSPAASKRMRRCREVVRTDYAGTVTRQWYERSRPDFQHRIDQLLATDLSTVDDRELVQRLHDARQLCTDGAREHFRVVMAYMYGVAELGLTCQKLLGWGPVSGNAAGGRAVRQVHRAEPGTVHFGRSAGRGRLHRVGEGFSALVRLSSGGHRVGRTHPGRGPRPADSSAPRRDQPAAQ
ncbi:hypothetical protein [Fodinicola feengrottensis]|uniref:hypothetical protein n=1 Tax=Fodinicola feengrottensis TaxID=435914 RepID=UPI0013D80674